MIDLLLGDPGVSCLSRVRLDSTLKASPHRDSQLDQSPHSLVERSGLVCGRGKCLIGLKNRGVISLDSLECVR